MNISFPPDSSQVSLSKNTPPPVATKKKEDIDSSHINSLAQTTLDSSRERAASAASLPPSHAIKARSEDSPSTLSRGTWKVISHEKGIYSFKIVLPSKLPSVGGKRLNHYQLFYYLYPAIEPISLTISNLFRDVKETDDPMDFINNKLLTPLGFSWNNNGDALLKIPDVPTLKEGLKGEIFKDLKIVLTNNITSHEEFIEIFIDGGIPLNIGPTFLHDIYFHITPDILRRYENIDEYRRNNNIAVSFVSKCYKKINEAKINLEKGDLKTTKDEVSIMILTLALFIDNITSTTNNKDFFDSCQGSSLKLFNELWFPEPKDDIPSRYIAKEFYGDKNIPLEKHPPLSKEQRKRLSDVWKWIDSP